MIGGKLPELHEDALGPERPRLFWRTLVKVMLVQAASLLLLWLLQTRYSV
jgi:hypothetical protein